MMSAMSFSVLHFLAQPMVSGDFPWICLKRILGQICQASIEATAQVPLVPSVFDAEESVPFEEYMSFLSYAFASCNFVPSPERVPLTHERTILLAHGREAQARNVSGIAARRRQEGRAHDVQQGEGGEQGDPLMPSLFALGQHQALVEARARLHPSNTLYAFLDDICHRAPRAHGRPVPSCGRPSRGTPTSRCIWAKHVRGTAQGRSPRDYSRSYSRRTRSTPAGQETGPSQRPNKAW